jgi:pyruvate dehydrogenase E2 component (dihydrolipoamide acetyltransferase)
MSKFEFKLPDIGEGVTEGEIVNWLVAVGDGVAEDQDLVEVMTDKATVTIGAPKAGKVAELKGEVGDVVPVGNVLVVLDLESGGAAAAAPAPTPPAAPAAAAPAPAAPAAETKASTVGDIK